MTHAPVPRVCCICGSDAGSTPASRDAGGQVVCVRCSAQGRRPARPQPAPVAADDGPVEVEGLTPEQLASLQQAVESPVPAPAIHPAEMIATSRKAARCAACGHDVSTTEGEVCPACGNLCRPRSSQAQTAAANARQYAADDRVRNRRTIVYASAGLAVTVGLRLAQRSPELLLEDARYLVVGSACGMAVYYLCCLIFIGFDQPLWVQLLRLLSVYLVLLAVLGVIVALPMSACMTLIIAPAVLVVLYVMLLKRELELDQLDAGIVGIVSGAAAFGGIVASYYV